VDNLTLAVHVAASRRHAETAAPDPPSGSPSPFSPLPASCRPGPPVKQRPREALKKTQARRRARRGQTHTAARGRLALRVRTADGRPAMPGPPTLSRARLPARLPPGHRQRQHGPSTVWAVTPTRTTFFFVS